MNINDFALTNEHKANLATLAAYLQSLPEDYKHFDMKNFLSRYGGQGQERHPDITKYLLENGGVNTISCTTVACAVGHGPSAGILCTEQEAKEGNNMNMYCRRVFGCSCGGRAGDMFEFLFGSEWVREDNTHWGAAARIRLLLAEENISGLDLASDYSKHLITKCIPLPRKRKAKTVALKVST